MSEIFNAIPLVFAQNGGAGAGAAAGAAGQNPGLWTFLPYIAIFGLWFWLLLIRPQQKQDRDRKSMLSAVKKNDKVLTTAGIYGTVMSVDPDDDRIVIRIDDDKGIKVAFSKGSIVRVVEVSPVKEKVAETA